MPAPRPAAISVSPLEAVLHKVVTPAQLHAMNAMELGALSWLLIESWRDSRGIMSAAPEHLASLARVPAAPIVGAEAQACVLRVVQWAGRPSDGTLQFPAWHQERERLAAISAARADAARAKARPPPPPDTPATRGHPESRDAIAAIAANAAIATNAASASDPRFCLKNNDSAHSGALNPSAQRSSAPPVQKQIRSAPGSDSFSRSAGALSASDSDRNSDRHPDGESDRPAIKLATAAADIERAHMRRMLESASWPWAGDEHRQLPPVVIGRILAHPHVAAGVVTAKHVRHAIVQADRLRGDDRARQRGVNPIARVISVLGMQAAREDQPTPKPWEFDLWFEQQWNQEQRAKDSLAASLDAVRALQQRARQHERPKEHHA